MEGIVELRNDDRYQRWDLDHYNKVLEARGLKAPSPISIIAHPVIGNYIPINGGITVTAVYREWHAGYFLTCDFTDQDQTHKALLQNINSISVKRDYGFG